MQPAVDVEQLLAEAARAAANQQLPIEAFMQKALTAYVRANPELIAELQERALLEHMERLRRAGRLPVN